MRHKSDLSGRSGRAVVLEYIEQRPLMFNNIGMGTKLKNYYRKKNATENPLLRFDDGDNVFLDVDEDTPFVLGDITPGKTIQTIDNNMFKAPIFKHQATTDCNVVVFFLVDGVPIGDPAHPYNGDYKGTHGSPYREGHGWCNNKSVQSAEYLEVNLDLSSFQGRTINLAFQLLQKGTPVPDYLIRLRLPESTLQPVTVSDYTLPTPPQIGTPVAFSKREVKRQTYNGTADRDVITSAHLSVETTVDEAKVKSTFRDIESILLGSEFNSSSLRFEVEDVEAYNRKREDYTIGETDIYFSVLEKAGSKFSSVNLVLRFEAFVSNQTEMTRRGFPEADLEIYQVHIDTNPTATNSQQATSEISAKTTTKLNSGAFAVASFALISALLSLVI